MKQNADTREFARHVHAQRLAHLSDARLKVHWERQVSRDPNWDAKKATKRSIYTNLLIEAAEERGITLNPPAPEAPQC